MFGSGSLDGVAIAGLILVAGGIFAVLHVWTAMALAKLFAKLGDASATAWIPVANIVTLLRLGEVNPATALFLVVPVVHVIGIVFLVTAINTINRRFGLGTGMTVLGFFSLPIWASMLGFGSRVPIGGVGGSGGNWYPPDSAAVEMPAEATPPPWAPYVAPDAAPPGATDVPPTHRAPIDVTRAAIAAPSVDVVSLPIATAPAVSPWQPPPLIIRRDESAVTDEPAESHEPPHGHDQADSDDETDADLEKTVVGRRGRAPVWYLTAEHSAPIRLAGTSALVGRNPTASANYPRAQLVILADPDKTVSKTHAHLSFANGRWSITDLNSTNGVYLMSASGDETEIEIGIGVQATDSFRLGDLTINLSTEGSPHD